MVQSAWSPKLAEGPQPLWLRLTEAIEDAISNGELSSGMRLPPHRRLAFDLGAAVGTISRAYAEAERRGLVIGHIGRGTYVAPRRVIPLPHRPGKNAINFGMNVPPIGPALQFIDQSFELLRPREDLSAIFDYTETAGLHAVREAGACWLKEQTGVKRASADRMIQTSGGHHALMLACSAFASRGDTILCDMATYPGSRIIAEHGGWNLKGVPGDQEGMGAETLDRAAELTGARLVLLIPTLSNPTTVTMSQQRREQIVEVARKRNLIIIEDDIYRVFGGKYGEKNPLVPLAQLAPERVVYVTSLSKALAPGLRLGFILAPDNDELHNRLLLAAQASYYCPPAIGGLIFASWLEEGIADFLLDEVKMIMVRRNTFARHMLGNAIADSGSNQSLHLWLPMSADRARYIHERALKAKVELTEPAAPYLDPAGIMGLRVCIGAPVEHEEFEKGIEILRTVLFSSHLHGRKGVI